MCCKIGIAVYAILQFCAFLFVLVGTPIDMFNPENFDLFGNGRCISLWGLKSRCRSASIDVRTNDFWATCTGRRDRFNAAAAFAIITIACYGVAALLGFIQLCCCACCRWLCLVLNILGIASGCIPWALMAQAYHNASGNSSATQCLALKSNYNYGAGFALLVVGWALNVLNIVFLMLPC